MGAGGRAVAYPFSGASEFHRQKWNSRSTCDQRKADKAGRHDETPVGPPASSARRGRARGGGAAAAGAHVVILEAGEVEVPGAGALGALGGVGALRDAGLREDGGRRDAHPAPQWKPGSARRACGPSHGATQPSQAAGARARCAPHAVVARSLLRSQQRPLVRPPHRVR